MEFNACERIAVGACLTLGGVLTNLAIFALVGLVLFIFAVALIVLQRMAQGVPVDADTKPVALVLTFSRVERS